MITYIERDESGKVVAETQMTVIRHTNDKGQLHCDDGPALEWPDEARFWYRNGKLHRENGPAIEWATGAKEWYRDGKHHRDDGPAIELPGGKQSWSLYGEQLSEQEFLSQASKRRVG